LIFNSGIYTVLILESDTKVLKLHCLRRVENPIIQTKFPFHACKPKDLGNTGGWKDTYGQDCQMVYFQTKNPILGKF
jgi:hypothetical protein